MVPPPVNPGKLDFVAVSATFGSAELSRLLLMSLLTKFAASLFFSAFGAAALVSAGGCFMPSSEAGLTSALKAGAVCVSVS